MFTHELLLKDTQVLEQEIGRHCAILRLDCSDRYQVQRFASEMMHNIDGLKVAASHGDATARSKLELYGMAMLLHEANIKAYGPDYMKHIKALTKRESAWAAIATAIWSELDDNEISEE